MSDFLIEEYKTTRARITADIDEINKNEVFFLTIMGVFYWFIFQFQVTDAHTLRALSLMPVVISIYSLLRYFAHRHIIKTHESYIKDHVEPILGPGMVGLVTYYDARSPKYLKPVRYTFHFVLIALSIAFSALTFLYPEYAVAIITAGVPS